VPWWFTGGANVTDPLNVTSSSAEMISRVMDRALSAARIAPRGVDVIKAHGTGTVANDIAEGQALLQVFEGRVPPLTSLKPYTGHTLGACGVLEAIVALACLKEGFMPATPGWEAP